MARATTKQKEAIEQRRLKVLSGVRQGLTYRQIGAMLGISHTQVKNDLDAALKETIRPVADEVRKLHIMRAEWLWNKVEGAIEAASVAGDHEDLYKGVSQGLGVLKRLAELEGTDAPLKVEATGFTKDSIRAEIARIEAQLHSGELDSAI